MSSRKIWIQKKKKEREKGREICYLLHRKEDAVVKRAYLK